VSKDTVPKEVKEYLDSLRDQLPVTMNDIRPGNT